MTGPAPTPPTSATTANSATNGSAADLTGAAPVPGTFTRNGILFVDTFAEAFPMTATRLIITAERARWALTAASLVSGNATSVIACDVEAAIERSLPPEATPDGRPGMAVLMFGFSRDKLASAVAARVGQCILTCPTTACYNGLPDADPEKRIRIGGQIRFFGDGFQSSKVIGARRLWRIPVMDGEFLCEDMFGTVKGVAGGNLLIGAVDQSCALEAAERAVLTMRNAADIILPFPGGIVRSGSKVGSRYKALKASTNEAYCPTLRARTQSELPVGTNAMYEIVIDGLSLDAVKSAMQYGLHGVMDSPGVTYVTAGNYGGKLGPYHIYLRDVMP